MRSSSVRCSAFSVSPARRAARTSRSSSATSPCVPPRDQPFPRTGDPGSAGAPQWSRPPARDRRRESCRVPAKVTLRGVGHTERLWPARVRWRLRGAWLWPAFALGTLADGVLLSALEPYDGVPPGLIGCVLLAGFANLFLVAVVAPLAGRRAAPPPARPAAPDRDGLRRRVPDRGAHGRAAGARAPAPARGGRPPRRRPRGGRRGRRLRGHDGARLGARAPRASTRASSRPTSTAPASPGATRAAGCA